MIKRKLTKHYSSNEYYLNKPVKVSKAQEDAYWENRKREREEKFVNDYYQENKYKLIPMLIIVTMFAYPIIKIGEVYQYCKNKISSNKINPEIIHS
jgi:hypothetical protein